MKTKSKVSSIFLVSVLGVAAGVACKPTTGTIGNHRGNETEVLVPPGSDAPVDDSGFYLEAKMESGVTHYLHEQNSLSTSCRVAPGETLASKKDIYCILDVAELDLVFYGFAFSFNAPRNMCAFTSFKQYSYYNWQAGDNSASFDVTKDANGKCVSATLTSGAGTVGSDCTPKCPSTYDHTDADGPNCCEGTWSMTIKTLEEDGTPIPGTTSEKGKWGGKVSNCLAGPGRFNKAEGFGGLSKDGYPVTSVFNTVNTGIHKKYSVISDSGESGNVAYPGIYFANYWNPADWTGVSPLHSSTMPPSTIPHTLKGPGASPYYQIECRDVADDIVARISLLVRSWDRVTNFTANSNPYDPGPEPDFPNENWHDWGVWKDYTDGSYPQQKY